MTYFTLLHLSLVLIFLGIHVIPSCHANLYGHEDSTYVNNVISNWGFEESLDPDNNWEASSTALVRRRRFAKHTGVWGLVVSNRVELGGTKDSGVKQAIKVADHPDLQNYNNFYLSCFIKFVNNATELTVPKYYIEAKYMYKVNYHDSSLNFRGSLGRLNYEFADTLYNQLGGNLVIPPGPLPETIEVWIRVEPVDIKYRLDSFAMTAIKPLGPQWRKTLQAKIDRVRKTNITLKTVLPSGVNPADTTIKVKMTRPRFKWGPGLSKNSLSGGNDPGVVETSLRNYMDTMCQWAVFTSAMTWREMEPTQYNVRYLKTLQDSIDWLFTNGFDIRVHMLLWEIVEMAPSWMNAMWGSELKDNMWRRIAYMFDMFKEKAKSHDVCNEFLHVHLFETRTGQRDLSLMAEEFEFAHSLDPEAERCINDYGILRDTQSTSAQANLAFKLRDHLHAPINCLAAQGHLRRADEFNLEVFLKRLDIISAPGLPITIGEFTVHAPEQQRAEIVEQALYAFYSNELVSGVIYWGISDQDDTRFEHDTALLTTAQLEPNTAGKIVEDLLLRTWRSSTRYTPEKRKYSRDMTLYHGTYLVRVFVDGDLIATKTIDVVPSSERLQFVMTV